MVAVGSVVVRVAAATKAAAKAAGSVVAARAAAARGEARAEEATEAAVHCQPHLPTLITTFFSRSLMKWRSVVHQARPSPGHSHPDAAPMIDMAQAVTCERSPGSTKSRLTLPRRQVDGSTIRQRGEAERTASMRSIPTKAILPS